MNIYDMNPTSDQVAEELLAAVEHMIQAQKLVNLMIRNTGDADKKHDLTEDLDDMGKLHAKILGLVSAFDK